MQAKKEVARITRPMKIFTPSRKNGKESGAGTLVSSLVLVGGRISKETTGLEVKLNFNLLAQVADLICRNQVSIKNRLTPSLTISYVAAPPDRGWNSPPPFRHLIEKKKFFKYNLGKISNIIKEQLEKVIYFKNFPKLYLKNCFSCNKLVEWRGWIPSTICKHCYAGSISSSSSFESRHPIGRTCQRRHSNDQCSLLETRGGEGIYWLNPVWWNSLNFIQNVYDFN